MYFKLVHTVQFSVIQKIGSERKQELIEFSLTTII